MAHTSGSSSRVQRLIALGATALLAVATAAAFGRVFSGPGVTMKLLLAGLLSVAVAASLERRSLVLATAISGALMLMVASLVVFPDSTWFGLPTMQTVDRIASSVGQVGEQARVQVAPTAPLQPLLLAAVTAVWAAVFSAHALAFRAGSPLLALLPPVALVAFADTVLEGVVKPIYGVLFLIAGLLVAFADGLRRIQGWGPVWGTHGSDGRLYRDAGRSARRVTATAVVLAALSPILVPGFGSSRLLDLSALNEDDRIALSPLVSIASELKRSEPFEVFRVQSPRPTYHRMIALSLFNGSTWTPSSDQQGSPIDSDASLLPADVIDGIPLEQTYRISHGTRYPWLAVAYAPASVSVERDLSLDRTTTTIWLDRYLDEGDSYSTSSLLVTPTPEQLDLVDFPATARTEAAVQLPTDLSPEIGLIADRWTEGSPSTYREILAIQDHLRDQARFTYSTEVPARGDSYTILDFLTSSRTGFCQQFATTMAVMLRTQGIPARVVVGFTQGTPVQGQEDTYRVTTDNYHSWVEVRFPFYGWLAFEPTPTRQNPVALPYSDPAPPCIGGCPTGTGELPPREVAIPIDGGPGAGLLGRLTRADEGRRGTVAALPPPEPPARPAPLSWLAAGLGLSASVLVAVPLLRSWRRRRRLRRAGPEPRRLILANYDLFTELAGDLGWGRAAAETPEEYRRKVRASGMLSDGDLDQLTALTMAAAYGRSEPNDEDVDVVREAATATLHDLRKATSPMKRITGLYRRAD